MNTPSSHLHDTEQKLGSSLDFCRTSVGRPWILGISALAALLLLNPTHGWAQRPWEDPVGPMCFELWITEAMARLNSYAGDAEFNSRKPWRINQYGMWLGRDSYSNYEPDRWDQYGRNKYWWIWEHYTYNPVSGWFHPAWNNSGVPPIRANVEACILANTPTPPPTPPGGLTVPSAPPGVAPGSSVGLGDIWDDTSPNGWTGTYTRRGSSDVFDATWTHPQFGRVTATLTVTRVGTTIYVRRTDTSGPQTGRSCNMMGTLSADQRTIRGNASCEWALGPMVWTVSIRASGSTPTGSGYTSVGTLACYGGAQYPPEWGNEASCNNLGCFFGRMDLDSCLAIGAQRGAREVVHGNSGGARPNECWMQTSCPTLGANNDFTTFRYSGGVPTPPPPTDYQTIGAYACFGDAQYPSAWSSDASCGGYGCNFGQLSLDVCLAVAARRGAREVIHGNPGGARPNECWMQTSCGSLGPHEHFTLYRH